jgi:hypothetical protein
MSTEQETALDPRVQRAIDELRDLVLAHYPDATFDVSRGVDDPQAVHLNTTVDVEDTDAVVDVVIDRMMELQIDEGLPIFVIPLRPVERALDELQRPRHWRPQLQAPALINP